MKNYVISFHGRDVSSVFTVPNNITIKTSAICGTTFLVPIGYTLGEIFNLTGAIFPPNSLCPNLLLSLGNDSDVRTNIDGIHQVTEQLLETVISKVDDSDTYKAFLKSFPFPGSRSSQYTYLTKKLKNYATIGYAFLLSDIVALLSKNKSLIHLNCCFGYPEEDLLGNCGNQTAIGESSGISGAMKILYPIGENGPIIHSLPPNDENIYNALDLSEVKTLLKYIYKNKVHMGGLRISLGIYDGEEVISKNFNSRKPIDTDTIRLLRKPGMQILAKIKNPEIVRNETILHNLHKESQLDTRYTMMQSIDVSKLIPWILKNISPLRVKNNPPLVAFVRKFIKTLKSYKKRKPVVFICGQDEYSTSFLCVLVILWKTMTLGANIQLVNGATEEVLLVLNLKNQIMGGR